MSAGSRRLATAGLGLGSQGGTVAAAARPAAVSPGTGTQSGVGAKTSLAGHAKTSVARLTSCQPSGDGQASNLQGLRMRTRQTPSELCSSKSHSARADAATKKLLAEEAAEQGKGRARSKKSNKMEKAGPAATRDESSKALKTPRPPHRSLPRPSPLRAAEIVLQALDTHAVEHRPQECAGRFPPLRTAAARRYTRKRARCGLP